MAESSYLDKIPVFNSSEPICATKPRYFVPEPVVLNIRESYNLVKFRHKYVIKSECDTWNFNCSGKLFNPFRASKILEDMDGTPIMKFWRRISPMGNTFLVVDWATGKELFKFSTNPGKLLKLSLRVEFKDVVTERQRLLVLKGEWERREALVFLGDPDEINGDAALVAKISRKPGSAGKTFFHTDDYRVDVAANVDIAFMVMLSIVFDMIKDNIQNLVKIPDIPIPGLHNKR